MFSVARRPTDSSFFRAVDMVKKASPARANATSRSSRSTWPAKIGASKQRYDACARRFRKRFNQTLNPREAALIQDTLMGKTPAEIAIQWGVAPKTVSNEKTRVLQKLRSGLADYEMN